MPKIWLLHGKGEEEFAGIIEARLKALGNSVRIMPAPYDSGEYSFLVQKALTNLQNTKTKLISGNKGERITGRIPTPEEAAMSILQQTRDLGKEEQRRKIFQLIFKVGDSYAETVERIQKRALGKGIFIARIVSSFYVTDQENKLPKVGAIPFVHIDTQQLSSAVSSIVFDRKPVTGKKYCGILAYFDGRHPHALTLDLPHYIFDEQYLNSGRFPYFASNVLSVQMDKKHPQNFLQIGDSRKEVIRIQRGDLHNTAAEGIHEAALKFEKARRGKASV